MVALDFKSFSSRGTKNAMVFPEPVLAVVE